MSNLIRSQFQAHPFHLVSPSPWPIFTCISLLTLTTTGVLTMHGFNNVEYFLYFALFTLISSMSFWFRDVISEGKFIYLLHINRNYIFNIIMFGFFLISACYLYGINTEPIYCIDGETENKLVKAAMAAVTPENVKSISPSVSGNTISLNTPKN